MKEVGDVIVLAGKSVTIESCTGCGAEMVNVQYIPVTSVELDTLRELELRMCSTDDKRVCQECGEELASSRKRKEEEDEEEDRQRRDDDSSGPSFGGSGDDDSGSGFGGFGGGDFSGGGATGDF